VTPDVRLHPGDCLDVLRTLPDASARCCVTSPPYWGLRDYGHEGQIGLEPTPEAYVARLVEVFREVRRVLADDGTLWLNLGDSYNGGGVGGGPRGVTLDGASNRDRQGDSRATLKVGQLKPKDLLGIPWRVAFALQSDGWWLRQDIIWHKPNPMPESVRDRCTKAHEYIFLMAKSERYYCDMEPIREPIKENSGKNMRAPKFGDHRKDGNYKTVSNRTYDEIKGANRRSVWTVTPKPFKGAHFAAMPPALAERCIKAGSAPGDMVLDPFAGSGTTGAEAVKLGRSFIGVELNPEYLALARQRIGAECLPLIDTPKEVTA
jgi:DNA modification methylase